jgi:hypothetical protein
MFDTRRKRLILLKKNHYLKLFINAAKEKNIGKAEYYYEQFLKDSIHANFCEGMVIGMQLNCGIKNHYNFSVTYLDEFIQNHESL